MNDLEKQIRVAVAAWVRDVFQTADVFVGEIAFEEEEERYLADVRHAVLASGGWPRCGLKQARSS